MKRLILTLIVGLFVLLGLGFAFVGLSGPHIAQHEIVKDIEPPASVK